MRKQTILLIAGLLGVSMLISAGIIVMTRNYKDNRQKKRDKEFAINDTINRDYNEFRKDLEDFANNAVDIIEEITDVTALYSSIESNYQLITDNINEYEKGLKDIEKKYKELTGLCVEKEYHAYYINNKCRAFEISMEQIINTFVRNLKAVNVKIEEYNSWAKEEGTEEYQELKEIEAKTYKDYVDYNKDGEYKSQVGD